MNDIDEYEAFLKSKIEPWSSAQRTAFAAAMAERWLHIYEKFSVKEQWGDLPALRRSLEAIWGHVTGRDLAPADLARHANQVEDCTPHMDDFDAYAALATCVIISEALECCGTEDNSPPAVRAALSGFEAAVENWAFDPDDQPRLWKQVGARNELKKQLKLLERIEAISRFNAASVEALRKSLTTADLIGKVSTPPKRTPTSAGLTNQAAFEQYRRMVESQLKETPWEPPPGLPFGFAMRFVTPWSARYSRRRQTLDGSYGRLGDRLGQQALIARYRAHDSADNRVPLWDADTRQYIALIYGNSANQLDARSMEQPHAYGPSLRRLWVEAKQSGKSDQDACAAVVRWARHSPAVWANEDQRKKKGLAHLNPLLGSYLARALNWNITSDHDFPWKSHVEGAHWQVRLNDFPDDLMYTLIIDGNEIGSFHDWPETWRRA